MSYTGKIQVKLPYAGINKKDGPAMFVMAPHSRAVGGKWIDARWPVNTGSGNAHYLYGQEVVDAGTYGTVECIVNLGHIETEVVIAPEEKPPLGFRDM